MNKNKVIAIVVTTAAIIYALWEVVGPDLKYNAAVAMMNEGKYEKAIAAFDALGSYKDSFKQKSECQTAIDDKAYEEAVALMNEGKYEEALAAFDALDGYKDSTIKARSIREKLNFEQMKAAEAGEYITFGAYYQNYYGSKEDIEWLVLERDDDKLFVISKYVLDRQLYNDEIESVTWETCTLRKWLNGTFLNGAFSKSERSLIQTTEVSEDKNPYWKTDPGEATNDKIFLLSMDEAKKYFASDKARICEKDNGDACSWWLRSPGIYQQVAACVKEDGRVSLDEGVFLMSSWQYEVTYVPEGVRPAMWIDLDA